MYILLFLALCMVAGSLQNAQADDRWQAPFAVAGNEADSAQSVITLSSALKLVVANNPTLLSLVFQRESAGARLKQAGLWPNPELDAEFEDVGWDAPGLTESEITISLSQELEIFGQRGARRTLAAAGMSAAEWDIATGAFDLYLEVKRRFYVAAHAQERLLLSHTSVELAEGIVDNMEFRISRGAALQSELLLASLELQRMQLAREEAKQEFDVARVLLTSLWNAQTPDIAISIDTDPDLTSVLDRLSTVEDAIDSTRSVTALNRQADLVRAETQLVAAEARPSITLSGGYKRLEADNSNSLLFGISLPLPLWNSRQGEKQSLESQARALGYELARERIETRAQIHSGVIRLRQLIDRHNIINNELLPTAESAFQTLRSSYDAGRLPYTNLLDAGRSLIELRFEHCDLLLSIQRQIIAIEEITGLKINTDL